MTTLAYDQATQIALTANRLDYERFTEHMDSMPAGPASADVWDAYVGLRKDVQVTLLLLLRDHAQVGMKLFDIDGPMVVAEITDNGLVVVLTADGKPMVTGWHPNPWDGDFVRYGCYAAGLQIGHGYLHPNTRRIVQTG